MAGGDSIGDNIFGKPSQGRAKSVVVGFEIVPTVESGIGNSHLRGAVLPLTFEFLERNCHSFCG